MNQDKIHKKYWIIFGLSAIIVSLIGFILLFSDVILIEVNYRLKENDFGKKNISLNVVPVDKNYSVIIPKIDINAKVISDVDPFNEKEYLEALTKGVAHAKGTSYPDQPGNTFIFAHSTTSNLLDVNRYNAIFYLLGKLDKGDIIYIVYKTETYQYKIEKKEVIDPDKVEILTKNDVKKTLLLMTCWPPGTTLKRLLITARAS